MFNSRMPKTCAIPQLGSAQLNPLPFVEHSSRRSHPQCEHSFSQGLGVGKHSKENVMR